MQNRYKSISGMKTALEIAMNGEKYETTPETESDFLTLIGNNLQNTELEPYIDDINLIIYWLMALTDDLDYVRKGKIQ